MFKKSIIAVIVSILLIGCSSTSHLAQETENTVHNASMTAKGAVVGGVAGAAVGEVSGIGLPAGAALGAIIGGAMGQYLDAHATLLEKLQKRGVYIIRVGDDVRIVMPSQRIFIDYSDQIRTSATKTLDMIAELLKGMTKVSMTIDTYAPMIQSDLKANLLTERQADRLEDYFYREGVDVRLMFAQGYGHRYPLKVKPRYFGGDDLNYRVEIRLRDYAHSQEGF
ncbi:MAG: hypothetical protein ACE365_03870 [Gammaproteobacteria bacterium]